MKKIIFALIFSVGLVGVANAEATNAKSVCENVDIGVLFYATSKSLSIGEFFYKVNDENYDSFSKKYLANNDMTNKFMKHTLSLLGTHTHYTEIKRSDKEIVCAYKLTFDYLKTQITEQELERFERFAAENDMYDWYNEKKR